MDHQPYDEWLLNDDRLTPEQDRQLRLHLRNCHSCSAQAHANLELRSAAVVAPPGGFSLRFQSRLLAMHKIQRRRTWIGMILLGVIGLSSILWLLSPYLFFLVLPPNHLAVWWMRNLIYLTLILRTISALASTLLRVFSSLIPIYAWPLAVVLLGGTLILWMVPFRLAGKIMKSAILAGGE